MRLDETQICVSTNFNKNNMKQKMTKEEFDDILIAFQTGKNEALIHMGVRLVAGNDLHLDYLSEIPEYMKTSLCRKVLRYVAKTALSGTFEIDGLASSCNFCEMEDGYAKSFANNVEWSFNHKGKLINVTIDSEGDEVYYYDKYSNEIWHCEIPYGVHWTQTSGKVDIVRMFEDFDLNRRR